jgi:hypothetical protein
VAVNIHPTDLIEEELCAECGRPFRRVFGEVLMDGEEMGLYSAELHREGGRPHAVLGMMFGFQTDDGGIAPLGVTCDLRWIDDGFQLMVRERPPDRAFYRTEMFGTMLGREEVLSDEGVKEQFFHISDHICVGDRRVRTHFGLIDA